MINIAERRRYLGQVNNNYVKSYTSRIIRINGNNLKGYAAQIKIDKTYRPFFVGENDFIICLRDNGYSEINFLPDNENWYLSAMYDAKGKIIEWYVDITRKNAIDEDGKPYCEDMYLDTAVMPDGRVLVFDEDELLAACENGNISKDEYDMAYRVLGELQDKQMLTVLYMENLCTRLLTLFENETVGDGTILSPNTIR